MYSRANLFLSQIRKQKSRPHFFQIFHPKMVVGYIWYRWRMIYLSLAMGLFIHLIEYQLLSSIFSDRWVMSLLRVKCLALIVRSFWWAYLEGMRKEVRDLIWTERVKRIEILGTWLRVSACISIALCGPVSWRFLTHIYVNHSTLSLSQWYAWILVINLSLNIVLSPLSSFVQSYKRVYRPWFVFLILQPMDLLIVLLLWPWLRHQSYVFAFGLLGLGALLVNAMYSLQAIRGILPFEPLAPSIFTISKKIIASDIRRVWNNMRVGLPMAISQIVLPVLFCMMLNVSHSYFDHEPGFIKKALYLIFPIASVLLHWPQLFYVDFMHFRKPWFHGMRHTLVRRVSRSLVWTSMGLSLMMMTFFFLFFKHVSLSSLVSAGVFVFFWNQLSWKLASEQYQYCWKSSGRVMLTTLCILLLVMKEYGFSILAFGCFLYLYIIEKKKSSDPWTIGLNRVIRVPKNELVHTANHYWTKPHFVQLNVFNERGVGKNRLSSTRIWDCLSKVLKENDYFLLSRMSKNSYVIATKNRVDLDLLKVSLGEFIQVAQSIEVEGILQHAERQPNLEAFAIQLLDKYPATDAWQRWREEILR